MSPAWNPNEYETVDSRIHRFYEAYPNGRIITELVDVTRVDGRVVQWVVKSYAYRDASDAEPASTGYAEEVVGSSPVNRTSSLENCETSSIGRCLSNLGLSPKGSRPSLEEMQKAERVDDQPPQAKKPRLTKAKFDRFVDDFSMAQTVTELDATASRAGGFDMTDEERNLLRDLYLQRKTQLGATNA